ncbi:MAG: hypothetical protein AAFU70_14165, partial [Planctomycetota bacterium]
MPAGAEKSKKGFDPLAFPELVGRKAFDLLAGVGAGVLLLTAALHWVLRSLTERKVRIGKTAIVAQIVRVG